eukprot:m.462573 g.462573  ORF g.462573 m.462573 type:complete len:96 (-) comp22711_c0_seq1:2287-2574(-)
MRPLTTPQFSRCKCRNRKFMENTEIPILSGRLLEDKRESDSHDTLRFVRPGSGADLQLLVPSIEWLVRTTLTSSQSLLPTIQSLARDAQASNHRA